MEKLFIKQAQVITPKKVGLADLFIENGRVYLGRVNYQPQRAVSAKGCYVTAGLFDLQVNGSPECNLWADPTTNQFEKLCKRLLKAGVTAFLPTLITDDLEHLQKNIAFLESMGATGKPNSKQLISMPGIHLEGPFLSPHKPGVHPTQYLRPLVMADFKKLARPSIKLITLAPELEGSQKAIAYLRGQGIAMSLGHSNATFDEAKKSFNSGVAMVTHIFNALPPLHQRQPGAVLAALLDENVYCCVIADGLHVDPNMIKLLVQMKGVDKVILVTDMASAGTTGGELVGSSVTLSGAVRNIVKWDIATFPEAIQMATLNPAKAMGLDKNIGLIKPGRRADLVVWDKKTLDIMHVIANGQLVL